MTSIPSISPPFAPLGHMKAATNLVTNGGFESNTTGWAAHGTGAGSPTRITDDSAEGVACASVSCNGSTARQGIEQASGSRVAVTPGEVYTIQARFKIDAGLTYEVGCNQMTAVSGGSFVTGNQVSGTATGDWQYASLTVTASGTTNALAVIVRKNGAVAATVKADAVQVEAGSVATPYVPTDGGTATRPATTWIA